MNIPLFAPAPAKAPVPFDEALVTGQHNEPEWSRYEAALRGIFERRHYTNHGPLARQFEDRLQVFLGVRHAICVTNATIGLMMAFEALGVSGRALVPGMTPLPLAHALAWCGIEAVPCDVASAAGGAGAHVDIDAARHALTTTSATAVVGVNPWGRACNAAALGELASRHGVPLVFDSSQAFGCTLDGRRIGGFGQVEVFSFTETNVLNASGAACVVTDDDELAARLRNIRSSYGAGRAVPVVKTSNGRMSEAQAAMGLLSLDDYAANRAHNASLAAIYEGGLRGVRGLRVVAPAGAEVSNHESLVVEIDEASAGLSRAALFERLQAFNVHALPLDGVCAKRGDEPPAAARRLAHALLLPIGGRVTQEGAQRVCALVKHVLDA